MSESVDTDCCIAGGGPAGMMLGLLLARAGVRVMVLEKHADFTRLSTRCSYMALMPQWDLLDLLANAGKRYPNFTLRMKTEARELIGERAADGGWTRVDGLQANAPDGPLEVRARTVVACDGRHSRMREVSGLADEALAAPMDVIWLALPRREDDGDPPVQKRIVTTALPLRLASRSPWLRGIAAHLVGLGVRPEMPKRV